MKKLNWLSVLVGFMALTVALTGCSQADNQPAVSTKQNQSRQAMVRQMGVSDMPEAMNHCDQMMMEHLSNTDQNYDQRFMDMMSRHHEGAIMMAQDALKNATHPEIKQFARKVINDQQKEMNQLQVWQQQWYGSKANQ